MRIVTDSSADVSPDISERLGISVVPNYVYFGSDIIRDGCDLAPQAFFEKMATSRTPPRTTHPPVSEFLSVYEKALNGSGFDAVLSIHVAGTLSGTINSAHAAAELLPDPGRIEVIDSGQLSMGLGWVVVKAAEMAGRGATRAEVVQAVRSLLPRVRVVAMIDTLDNLVRGGRISQLRGALGTLLHIKPVLSIQSGQVSILGRVRTRTRALSRLIEEVQGWGQVSDLAVMHAAAEPLAAEVARRLRAFAPEQAIRIAPAGAALTAHLGLGAVGVCGLQSAPE